MSGTITVYDPYLYSGKFDTASRRAAGVVVSGNSAYVTETAFKQYANYRNFWIFSNDEGEGNNNTGDGGEIIDNTPPTVTVTVQGTTTNSITVNVTARDNETGMVSQPQ